MITSSSIGRVVLVLVSAAIAYAAPALANDRPAAMTGAAWNYQVAAGDTWRTIGSRVGVDPPVLSAANGLTINTVLRPGQILRIDNRHIVPDALAGLSLIVNVPQRMLFVRTGSGVVTGFPVAVGRRDWPTPIRPFTVISRERDPSWEVPTSIQEEARRAGKSLPAVVPPGPDNPLGQFWLGLSTGGVGIHGTNAPASIYRVTTHGCIRLHPDDIAQVFESVAVGMPGQVIYEPVLLAVVGDAIWLEAHPDAYRRARGTAQDALRERAAVLGITDRIDWPAVDRVLRLREGIARQISAASSN